MDIRERNSRGSELWETGQSRISQCHTDMKGRLSGIFRVCKKGYAYKGKKPVHCCPSCVTALAEAEVEYADKESPSVFVKFGVESSEFGDKMPSLKGKKDLFVIWTTTPWTLPANLALAFHPDITYVAIELNNENTPHPNPLPQGERELNNPLP